MSVLKCLFFQDLEGLTEVFGGMSAEMSGPKLPLWAKFSFLIRMLEKGVEFRGAFMTVLAILMVLALLDSTLPSLSLGCSASLNVRTPDLRNSSIDIA